MLSDMSRLKIFSGTSNKKISEKISTILGLRLANVNIKKFSDGEISVSLEETVIGYDCFVVQSLCKPVNDNLVELLIIIDALKRASAGRINVVIPYFGYARQDKRSSLGEPITARLIADLIDVSNVIVMDLHSLQIEGFFNVPVHHISGLPIFGESIKNINNFNNDEFIVVAPDVGAVKKSRELASIINCKIAIVDKHRKKANCSEVMNIIGDVDFKNIIIIDDIIDTGGTVCNASKFLVEFKNVKSVLMYATHAVCSGQAISNLASEYINQVTFLDTIPIKLDTTNKKFKILSAADIFADKIKKIHLSKV
ncbi:MAG: ribose-phosphate diphosphokinase [Firmicutes bacterium]|nr:ribose-phosphate diphosphokinase [Bacillota bacterium]